MKQRIFTAVAAIALVQCAGVSTGRQAKDLEVRVAELEASNAELRREVQELNTRLQMLQSQSPAGPPAVSASGAETPAAPAHLEVVRVAPPTRKPAVKITPWPSQPTAKTADGRVITLADLAPADNSPAPAEPDAPAEITLATPSAAARYDEAMRLFQGQDYSSAIVGFQLLTEDRTAGEYYDRARFGLGQCYSQLGEHEQAIQEYLRLANDRPESSQAPEALLQAGLSFRELGQTEQALETVREVVILYPFSEAARRAEAKIKDWTR